MTMVAVIAVIMRTVIVVMMMVIITAVAFNQHYISTYNNNGDYDRDNNGDLCLLMSLHYQPVLDGKWMNI